MKINVNDQLQLSLLGFTTLTMKLISLGNMTLLHKAFHFINKLFIQSSVEVKNEIIAVFLLNIQNFLIDCDNRKQIIAMFPFWMRTEYRKAMKQSKTPDGGHEFVLYLN